MSVFVDEMNERSTPPPEFDLPLGVPSLEVPDELGNDPRIALRRTLGMFATGVTVVTTREGGQVHGLTVNAFMSVSLEPPLVLVSIERRTKLCGLLDEGRSYGVSVLRESQSGLSDHFAHRSIEGVPEPRFDLIHDTPLVMGALAHFVATVTRCYWGGDHSLFLGHVVYARYGEGTPLLFHGGRYERLGQVG
jgi:flavin reductase (DIM6/NTAB) family NADH-FMN oxidoreductase RutF